MHSVVSFGNRPRIRGKLCVGTHHAGQDVNVQIDSRVLVDLESVTANLEVGVVLPHRNVEPVDELGQHLGQIDLFLFQALVNSVLVACRVGDQDEQPRQDHSKHPCVTAVVRPPLERRVSGSTHLA